MRRVIIESPYAGDVERNITYLRACLRDSLLRGEAPFASHALYTQPGVLDDNLPTERKLGIEAGFVHWTGAKAIVFYIDLGMSPGMQSALRQARVWRKRIEYRAGLLTGRAMSLNDAEASQYLLALDEKIRKARE